jgi:hypothetical protein
LGIAAFAASLAVAPAFAAPNEMKIGALRCEVSGGLGLIIASSKTMDCIFTPAQGRQEHYVGSIHKFGLDIGTTNQGVLAWDVFAPTAGPRRHALAGNYVGVGAGATVGAGLGANALIGGDSRAFTLQPLSIQTQTGLDLAAGVSSMSLRPAGA